MTQLVPVKQSVVTELITCRVGDQWLGLPVEKVREIVIHQPYTVVPLAPSMVCSLINLRGKVMTQIELRSVMQYPPREKDGPYHVAIIETDSGEDFGVMVDEVGEVIAMDSLNYEATPKTLPEVWRRVSNGVLKQKNRVLVLVDVEKLIAQTLPQSLDDSPVEVPTIH